MEDRYCLIDGCHGVHIPRIFKERYLDHNGPNFISKFQLIIKSDAPDLLSDWINCLSRPDSEYYWECWDEVISVLTLMDTAGNRYYLEPDGDLFLNKVNKEENL